MPFKSEKQRRYLWANEPEIARDWTDTYGSGIAKALGGRIPFRRGGNPHSDAGGRTSSGPGGPPGGGATSMGSGRDYSAPDRGPGPDRHPPAPTPAHTVAPTAQYDDRIQRMAAQNQRTSNLRNQAAGAQGFHQFLTPRVGPTARPQIGGGLGNWAANYAGANIGASLGMKLIGGLPGLILGTLFGGRAARNFMNPAYKGAGVKNRLQGILGLNNLNLGGDRDEEVKTVDIRELYDRRPHQLWLLQQAAKKERLRKALESQEITEEDLMGIV
jgi:hypothetical protein